MKRTKIYAMAVLCFVGLYLCLPGSASANLVLQDFIDGMEVKGDLRIRYEYMEKDVDNEDATDRLRQRFRLGMKWNNPDENWKIAAGLATGGSDATSTNDTYSDNGMFDTGDIRLDFAYAEHKLNNFKFIAGQQKNLFETTGALWDGDVRPAGFTGVADFKPMFVTVGWYDVLYVDRDIAQMEAIQVGAKTDMFTAALAFYNYHDTEEVIDEVIVPALSIAGSGAMDSDYAYQIIDLYLDANVKTDMAKISPYAQVFYNMGAEGEEGQSLLGGDLDPEEENMGYAAGINAGIDKFKLGVEWASIGADSCNPLLKDSDFGSQLKLVDVEGFKIGLGYKITKNYELNATAYLYEAKERDIDQDPKTYHIDMVYKF